MPISNRIHQALRESRLTLVEAKISEDIDLDALTLLDHVPLLVRIAAKTGVTVDWLLTGREPMRPVYLYPASSGEPVPIF